MHNLFSNFTAKPHKPFFFGGILNGIIFMAVLLVQYTGLAYPVIAPAIYHAYTMFFAVFTQFFAAFLFTMFPRFLVANEVPKNGYISIFLLLNLSSLLFAVAVYVSPHAAAIGMVGLFLAHAAIFAVLWRLHTQGSSPDRYDTNWILGAFALGLLSHLLFLFQMFGVGPVSAGSYAINIGFFLYLFLLVLTLSQKMIPFFTENKVAGYRSNKTAGFLEAVFLLLMAKVALTVAQVMEFGFIVDLLLFGLILRELIQWRLPFLKVDAMLWVLYLSLLWIPFGFFLFFLEGIVQLLTDGTAMLFEKTPLHAIAIGYFMTIAVGFGSRIILGHAGQKPIADRLTIGLFWLVQLLVMARIAAGLSLNQDAGCYAPAIAISSALWLLLFLFWAKRYLKLLFQ
jgi:uncharacterized protein involved in response to NO